MPDVQLQVGGSIYSGWTAMRVERSIEQAAGAFALEVTERWPGQPLRWPIEPGARCALMLDGETVITGYVDSVERGLDAAQHNIRVNGRDAAGDLVDCSALQQGERLPSIHNQTLLQIVTSLAGYYGVAVTADVPVGSPFSTLDAEPGESVWDNISRAARMRALLILSDGIGGLVITRAGDSVNPVALVEGENVKAARLVRDNTARFSRYIALGQDRTDGSEDYFGADAASPRAVIEDPAIRSPRTLLFVVDSLADGITLKDRVRWERNVRRGQGRRLEVTVQGWSAQGRVWRPNEMVQVSLPTLGIDGQLLIVAVAQSLDASGTVTTLTLSPREAYDLLPEAPAENAGGSVAGVDAATLELLK